MIILSETTEWGGVHEMDEGDTGNTIAHDHTFNPAVRADLTVFGRGFVSGYGG